MFLNHPAVLIFPVASLARSTRCSRRT
jgi:hypothetical protein